MLIGRPCGVVQLFARGVGKVVGVPAKIGLGGRLGDFETLLCLERMMRSRSRHRPSCK